MTAQSATAITVPVNTDQWKLTTDLMNMANTTRAIIPAATVTDRDNLAALFPGSVLPVPTFVFRLDTALVEVWNGTSWRILTATSGAAPFATSAGEAVWAHTGASSTQAVSFPVGRFSVAPRITLGKSMSTNAKIQFYVTGVSASGFTMGAQTTDGTSVSLTVACNWTATQMTPTTGAG